MNTLIKIIKSEKNISLIFFILSFSCFFITTDSVALNLIIHSVAMIPLAFILGELTSSMSEFIGEKKGGLLTATLGNLPEIIMGLWSIKLGLIPMVQAALIGSIVNNMLLVLGISTFLGGIKYKQQRFNRNVAKTNFSMLLLAVSSMTIIACLNYYADIQQAVLIRISVIVSIILIIVYVLGLVFSIYTHKSIFGDIDDRAEENKKVKYQTIGILFIKIIIITLSIYFLSEKVIVDASEVIEQYDISQMFMGIILIPLLGNIGENISAIVCAVKNKVNLSLEIAIGSSIQIALFATPVLVLSALFLGVQLSLVFSVFHIIVTALAIFMSYIVFVDGSTYWFEGTVLIAVYIVITLCYFYI